MDLSTREFALAEVLMRYQGKVMSRQQIFRSSGGI
ncbi:MAG: winged helix-turn-helix domain-containing protein [Synechococcus sp.]